MTFMVDWSTKLTTIYSMGGPTSHRKAGFSSALLFCCCILCENSNKISFVQIMIASTYLVVYMMIEGERDRKRVVKYS